MQTKSRAKSLNPLTGLLCFLAVLVFVVLLPAEAPLWKSAVLIPILFALGIIFLPPARFFKSLSKLTFILMPLIILFLAVSLLFSKHMPAQAICQVGQIILRALVLVLADLVFILSQKTEDLLVALSGLKIPSVFIQLLSSGLRYSHIFTAEAASSFRARLARDRCRKPFFERLKITGLIIEKIFWRAVDRSHRVYAGMLSRGYDGNLYFHQRLSLPISDYLILGGFLVTLVILALI